MAASGVPQGPQFRAFRRHERLTVRMELAASFHHSAVWFLFVWSMMLTLTTRLFGSFWLRTWRRRKRRRNRSRRRGDRCCSRSSLRWLPCLSGAARSCRRAGSRRSQRLWATTPRQLLRRLPRGARIRRCGQGFRSRSSLSGAQCSLLLLTGLRCSASWLVCTRRTAPRSSSFYGSGMCFAGLAGYDTPRVMLPSGVARPRMLCIMADLHQKDSTLRALVVNHGSGIC